MAYEQPGAAELQEWTRRAGHVGLDERAIQHALRGNYLASGIGSVDPELRIADAARYSHMTMAGPETDPINMTSTAIDPNVLAARAAALERKLIAAQQPQPQPPQPQQPQPQPPQPQQLQTGGAAPLQRQSSLYPATSWRPDHIIGGIRDDLASWESLPCAPGCLARLQYVCCRGNRTVALLAVLSLLVLVALLIRMAVRPASRA